MAPFCRSLVWRLRCGPGREARTCCKSHEPMQRWASAKAETVDGRRRQWCRSGDGLPDQVIDHSRERLLLRGPRLDQRREMRDLPVGAGAACQDQAGVLELGGAAERLGILAQHGEEFIDQIGEWHQLAFAEI